MAGSVLGLCVALALPGLRFGLGCCLLGLDAGELDWAGWIEVVGGSGRRPLSFVGSGLGFLGLLGLVDWPGLWMRGLVQGGGLGSRLPGVEVALAWGLTQNFRSGGLSWVEFVVGGYCLGSLFEFLSYYCYFGLLWAGRSWRFLDFFSLPFASAPGLDCCC